MNVGTKEPPTSAAAVANFFLDKATAEGVPVDHLKLQKLVYYAYGWYAGHGAGSLFSDDIQAWKHGPVIPELYNQFRGAGGGSIPNYLRAGKVVVQGDQVTRIQPVEGDQSIVAFLNNVWAAYKDFSGIALSNMSHKAGEPWQAVVAANGGSAKNQTIDHNVIATCFAKLLDAHKQAQPG